MSVVETALREQGVNVEGQGVGRKNDPPLSPSAPYLHGPAGLLNRRDLENPVMSTIMGPMAGVANALPVYNGSRNVNGEWGGEDASFDTIITGVTKGALDDFANQPTTDCADGPVGGLLKLCTIVNTFGHYTGNTREVSMQRAGRVADRVDARYISIINAIPAGLFATPSMTPSLQNALNNELASRIFEAITSFQRMFAPRVFSGSPANNSGSRKDIVGLDIQINENNKFDATMQALCTAANSDIKRYGFDLIRTGARNIVQYIEMADKFSQWRSSRQGLGRVEGFIAMRPELWWEVSEVIPVVKFERVLATINRVTNGRAVVDGTQMYNERNSIRESHLIPVNGRMIEVVEDDTIPELDVTTAAQLRAGQYASDMYFVPTTVMNGQVPVAFWEYFDHGNNQANAIQQLVGGSFTFTTDGGMFRWHVNFKNGCVTLKFEFDPRLRVRATQLGWRITNIAYEPLQHLTSWNPDSQYFVDGGVTQGETQRYYSSWSPSTPAAI